MHATFGNIDARNKVQWDPGFSRSYLMPPKDDPPDIVKDREALIRTYQQGSRNNLSSAPQTELKPQLVNVIDRLSQQVAARVEERVIEHLEHMAPPVKPALLTVKDAAAYLGRSEQSIQHLIFTKELPVVRVGRRVHLDRRDLDLWIEKNKY